MEKSYFLKNWMINIIESINYIKVIKYYKKCWSSRWYSYSSIKRTEMENINEKQKQKIIKSLIKKINERKKDFWSLPYWCDSCI